MKTCAKIWPLIFQGGFCCPAVNSGVAVVCCRTFLNNLSGARPAFSFFSSSWVMNFGD